MFHSFARRMTAWYVVATVVLVTVLLAAVAIGALFLYVRIVDEGVETSANSAIVFAARALQRKENFASAALEFERRDRRTGVRTVAVEALPFPPGGPPRVNEPRAAGARLPLRAPLNARSSPEPQRFAYVNGTRIRTTDLRSVRFSGDRIGFAVASLFGAHFRRVPFLGGDLTIVPDADAVGRLTELLLLGIVAIGGLAAIAAFAAGRYITKKALQPLVEVTAALQRFAGRDFTPQTVTVAGKSEFDAIALAYNAAAAQVAQAFAEREATDAQMRQFVADAGHELRTPLTIVLGYIELLKRRADEGDERSRKIFAAIGSEGARMRSLIDNLVLLARLEAEDRRPVEPFALGALLDEIVEARRVLAPAVRIRIDASVDAMVIGNREELHEAIANVVDNALKYAPGATVTLRTAAAYGAVDMFVHDDGPGIAAADRDRLFERFYRGVTRGEVEGSGLGLAIARRAVERSGGSLTLFESTSRGTTFRFCLRASELSVRPKVSV